MEKVFYLEKDDAELNNYVINNLINWIYSDCPIV